jgi:hypothetical protein
MTFMDRAIAGEWPDAAAMLAGFVAAYREACDANGGEPADFGPEPDRHPVLAALGVTPRELWIIFETREHPPCKPIVESERYSMGLAYIVERRREEARLKLDYAELSEASQAFNEMIAEERDKLRALVTEWFGDGCIECGRDTGGGGTNYNGGEPHKTNCGVAAVMGWATSESRDSNL